MCACHPSLLLLNYEVYFSETDDFFKVYSELHPAAAQWEGIWLALTLSVNDLDTTRARCSNDPERGLRATVQKWLNKNYDHEKHGNPSWKMLAEAVAHKCGGNNKALAEGITRRHGKQS